MPLAAANLYFGYPSNRLMKSAGREKDEIGLDVEDGQPTFGSRAAAQICETFYNVNNKLRER